MAASANKPISLPSPSPGYGDQRMDRLSLTFSALADPTRRAILARLSSGPASVNELAAPFSMSLPAVSKHLKVLERAQLIAGERRRNGGRAPSRLRH